MQSYTCGACGLFPCACYHSNAPSSSQQPYGLGVPQQQPLQYQTQQPLQYQTQPQYFQTPAVPQMQPPAPKKKKSDATLRKEALAKQRKDAAAQAKREKDDALKGPQTYTPLNTPEERRVAVEAARVKDPSLRRRKSADSGPTLFEWPDYKIFR